MEDLYPTTIAKALRYVAELPERPPEAIARIIKSLIGTRDDSLIALIHHEHSPLSNTSDSVSVPSFNLWAAMADSHAHIRLEAVGIALSTLDRFFSTDVGSSIHHVKLPAAIRLLCQILIDRSTDKHLPVAQRVLSHQTLWSRSPPCISLASVFQQLYFMLRQLISTDLWNVAILKAPSPPLSSLSATDLLVFLLCSHSPSLQRFIYIMEALTTLLSSCPTQVGRFSRNESTSSNPVFVPGVKRCFQSTVAHSTTDWLVLGEAFVDFSLQASRWFS